MGVLDIALMLISATTLGSRFFPERLILPIPTGGKVCGGEQDILKTVTDKILQIITLSFFAKWLSNNSALTGRSALCLAQGPGQYLPCLSEFQAASRFTGRTMASCLGKRP